MSRSKILGTIIAIVFLFGCTVSELSNHTQEECEEALASFSVVPTTTQNTAERREMLETINSVQVEEFADCEKFPGWKQKFERAYQEALT